ncbi:outer membrane lipoprotein carrier protein LolA, partial [Candidatus Pacearchaeota archaeon]|nr:outer membrane lipoprotein carrier protein LolA [Candidatus Pacearchaeota archaeon]
MKNYISIDTKEILTSLERKMSKIDTIQTKFVQTKDLALFNQIIEIKGSLFLKKPHMFAWHIDSPLKQIILLEDNRIKQWDEDTNKVQTFSLSENPSFNIAIEQMSRWISGEYLLLTDEYVIEILKKKPIQLKFTPLENAMAHSFIDSITILFQDDEKYIKEIMIQESSGDTTSF